MMTFAVISKNFPCLFIADHAAIRSRPDPGYNLNHVAEDGLLEGFEVDCLRNADQSL